MEVNNTTEFNDHIAKMNNCIKPQEIGSIGHNGYCLYVTEVMGTFYWIIADISKQDIWDIFNWSLISRDLYSELIIANDQNMAVFRSKDEMYNKLKL